VPQIPTGDSLVSAVRAFLRQLPLFEVPSALVSFSLLPVFPIVLFVFILFFILFYQFILFTEVLLFPWIFSSRDV
jgi:hypothetical protein